MTAHDVEIALDPGPVSQTFGDAGPSSGVVSSPLFRGEGGPGYWIDEELASGLGVVFPGASRAAGSIIRISPEAIWFLPEGRSSLPADLPTRIDLVYKGELIGPLRGRIVPLSRRGDSPHVGFRVTDVPLAAGRRLLLMLNELIRAGAAEPVQSARPVQEELTDPARVRAVVAALATVGNRGALHRHGKMVRLHLHRADAESGLLCWDTLGGSNTLGPGPHEVDVIGYNSVYRLTLASAWEEDGRVITPFPTRVRRVRHRWFRRGAVESSNLRVAYRHPLWRELPRVVREVRDISFGGVCFTTSPEDDMAFPGLLIPILEITSPGGETISLCGEVRSIAPARGGEPAVCGMSVTPCSSDDEVRWLRLVSEALYPSTRTSEDHAEPLWSLFEDAGYFNLAGKSAEYFSELKKGFVEVAERAAKAPHLICQAVWPSSRGVEASVSFCKPYEHAWMGHQLARRPGKRPDDAPDSGQIMRDIYLRAFEHPQADPAFRWMIGYIEPSVPWMNRAHLDFARRFMATGEALAMPLRMMKASCADTASHAGDGLDVGPATPEETALLTASIAATHPLSYRESHDLVAERIDLHSSARSWQAFGFQRSRAILVARRGGRPVAAIVMETGEVGTNLFCLLDSTRIFPLAEGAKAAYPRLLDEARAWFRAEGRESFLYLREDDDWSYARSSRLADVSPAALWVISAGILPDFLEHVCELTGRRRPVA